MPHETLPSDRLILAEGAVIERLQRGGAVEPDPQVANALLVEDAAGRRELTRIYLEYLEIARDHHLPILLLTPTWRAGRRRLAAVGREDLVEVNQAGVRFLQGLRREADRPAGRILIGGLMGPEGDAYDPGAALPAETAERIHSPQARALAEAGVDLLVASTLPALTEAVGLARAMARTGTPYAVSFVLRPDGGLLDGTPLDAAITRIDGQVQPSPWAYMANCTHPHNLEQALDRILPRSPGIAKRLVGLQANASPLPPEELDGAPRVHASDPGELARAMIRLHHRFGLRILGGCCGTDGRHIRALATRMAARRD